MSGRPVAPDRVRRGGAWVVLVVLLAALAAATIWAVRSSAAGSPGEATASVGQRVAVPGGSLVVQSVLDVDLSAPMAGPGMAMQGSAGVPDIPDGFRQLDVEVRLAADPDRPMPFQPERFTVAGPGVPAVGAVAADEGADAVPAGSVLSRQLRFQVPEAARELRLTVPGIARPVTFVLGAAPGNHGH